MEKVSVAKLVEFRRKTENSKRTFINNLKKPTEHSEGGGGDYWITSVSAISGAFRLNSNQPIHDKIEELVEKKRQAPAKITKDMFQRNIDILNGFTNFNMAELKPELKMNFIPIGTTTIQINNIPIQIRPQRVFTFEDKGIKKVGAIWFVAKLGGFKNEEIGLFSESLYKHLEFNFSKDYEIDFRFCLSLDVVTCIAVK
ncbi:MAG TPA: hypothetical protein VEC12_12180, partial [Bacteroidia bacterium]|nr:hypothetical protein [Bacteroidia bacterium]